MNKSFVTFSCFLLIVLMQFSCMPKRNLVYLSDLNETANYQTEINDAEPKIQSGDILSVTISSLNPESNALFNGGQVQGDGSNSNQIVSSGKEGYEVSNFGEINFPILGKIKLSGLTKEQAVALMTIEIEKYIKSPIINIRYLNFKITVVGEVSRPASYNIVNNKVNLIEALGLAGDMTVFGKRDNVLVIREENGIRTMGRVNLNNKSVFDSSFFNLKQNDIVYIEPVKSKTFQASSSTRFIPLIVGITSVVAIALSRINF